MQVILAGAIEFIAECVRLSDLRVRTAQPMQPIGDSLKKLPSIASTREVLRVDLDWGAVRQARQLTYFRRG